jgi:hypothetical protein
VKLALRMPSVETDALTHIDGGSPAGIPTAGGLKKNGCHIGPAVKNIDISLPELSPTTGR